MPKTLGILFKVGGHPPFKILAQVSGESSQVIFAANVSGIANFVLVVGVSLPQLPLFILQFDSLFVNEDIAPLPSRTGLRDAPGH